MILIYCHQINLNSFNKFRFNPPTYTISPLQFSRVVQNQNRTEAREGPGRFLFIAAVNSQLQSGECCLSRLHANSCTLPKQHALSAQETQANLLAVPNFFLYFMFNKPSCVNESQIISLTQKLI